MIEVFSEGITLITVKVFSEFDSEQTEKAFETVSDCKTPTKVTSKNGNVQPSVSVI